ncbi:Predicted arabinose efflux permease, MFS family [Sphingopyxis indica]|uniref:Predicted arabinose efflux permease, MFS family n=2 Tax=Sphingopyxis indica TaxID=436663 RepID=A0A239HB54_9SPHN|nr:Predicted arabinose efflux permease, MFS family [Sphingopyxis indica]
MVEVRRRPWFTVIMLSAVYACSQLDRQIMGILLEPIKRDLGASDAQMGFLVGLAFAVFYTFLAIPIAMLADKGHRKNIIAASIILWSAMTAVCGMATTYLHMALARIGVAVGESGSSPASVSMIANLFDAETRATAMSVFVFGANVGMLMAFLGGGWLLDTVGWRETFLIIGIPGIILGLMVLLLVPEPPTAPEAATDAEKASLASTIRHMAANAPMRHILIGKSLGGFVGYGMVLWIPTFLVRSHGLSGTEIGLTLALFVGLAGGIGTLMSGRIADFLGKRDGRWRSWSIAISKVVTIPFLLGFFLVESYELALALYVIPATIGAYYLAPSSALIQQLVDDRMRAVAAAVSFFLLNMVGMGLGPQGVGLLSDLLAPAYGNQSLRYALAAFVFVNLWAAFHFWRAGSLLPRRAVQPA